MVQNLEAMQDTITPRTILENDLAAASFDRTQAAIHIVNYYKTDTLPNSPSADSIKYYLKQLSTFEGYLQLAETYMEEGDAATANATIDTLLANFELTTEQQNEANHYKQLNNIRNGITAENRTIYELTTGEVNTLQQISDTSNLFAGGITRAMLRQNGVANEPWVYVPNTNMPKRVQVRKKAEDEENKAEAQEYFDKTPTVYPNPTTENFKVELNVKEEGSILKINSVDGKEVFNQLINVGNQKIIIETSGWSKGIYLIRVENDRQVIFEQKVTLH